MRFLAATLSLLASSLCAQNSPQQTVIEGDNLVIESKPEGRTVFVFSDNVRIIGKDLIATCDRLEVLSQSKPAAPEVKAAANTPVSPGQLPLLPTTAKSPVGAIEVITASGNVEIFQLSRHATADKAEIFPNAKVPTPGAQKEIVGKIILSGSPKVVDGTSTLSGGRITLLTGEGRIIVEPDKADPQNTRPSVILDTPQGK